MRTAAPLCRAAILIAGLLPSALAAAPPTFKDRKIEITVGYDVAGSPDVMTRLVARHLGRFLPGNPTLFVANRPGAGGVLQTSYMANLAPSDGSSIGYIARASALQQIANRSGARFDMAAFRWFGALSQQNQVVFMRRDKNFTSVDDMKRAKSPVVYAARANGGSDLLAGKALEALGVPLKIVLGYEAGQTNLAFEQGEIDGSSLTESGLRQRADWLKPGGLAVMVVAFGSARPASLAFGDDLVPPPAKTAIYALINKALALPVGTFAGPPGLSPETAEIYRRAFGDMESDGQFLADARRNGIDIDPMSGADLQNRFADFLHAGPAASEEFAKLVE